VDNNELNRRYKKLTGITGLIKDVVEYCECELCKLRYFFPLITGDEAFYNTLQAIDWYYLDQKAEYLEAKKHIERTDTVLEVGSGKGAFVKFLPTKQYIGLDFSTNAKEMALKDGIIIENELIEDYAAKNSNKFDVVISFQVLEHVSNPQVFIQAKIDALRVGGKLIIAVPSEDSFLKYATNNVLNMPPHHVTRWPDETLYYIAERYNLQVLGIYHEKLQNIHKQWFMQTLISSSFIGRSLLSSNFIQEFVIKFAGFVSKCLVHGLKEEVLPRGHTVMVVYRKR